MYSKEDVMEILEAFDLTKSYRAAGLLCGVDHHTVAAKVAARAAGLDPGEVAVVVSVIEPFIDNTPPCDADVWFHLADDSGWVTFAGVRAAATVPDPESGFGPGSDPVPLDPSCQGSYRP